AYPPCAAATALIPATSDGADRLGNDDSAASISPPGIGASLRTEAGFACSPEQAGEQQFGSARARPDIALFGNQTSFRRKLLRSRSSFFHQLGDRHDSGEWDRVDGGRARASALTTVTRWSGLRGYAGIRLRKRQGDCACGQSAAGAIRPACHRVRRDRLCVPTRRYVRENQHPLV